MDMREWQDRVEQLGDLFGTITATLFYALLAVIVAALILGIPYGIYRLIEAIAGGNGC